MGLGLSKQQQQQVAVTRARCSKTETAYRGCVKANPDDAKGACDKLEYSVIHCYALQLCEAEAKEHMKCVRKLVNAGSVNGRRDCNASIAAMRTCLKKYKLHQVPPPAAAAKSS